MICLVHVPKLNETLYIWYLILSVLHVARIIVMSYNAIHSAIYIPYSFFHIIRFRKNFIINIDFKQKINDKSQDRLNNTYLIEKHLKYFVHFWHYESIIILIILLLLFRINQKLLIFHSIFVKFFFIKMDLNIWLSSNIYEIFLKIARYPQNLNDTIKVKFTCVYNSIIIINVNIYEIQTNHQQYQNLIKMFYY